MPDTAPATTAARAVLMALGRHALTAGGTALVAHGWVDQQTATSAVGPIAEYLVGAGLAAGAAGFSAFKAWLMHQRWVRAWLAPAQSLAAEPAA